MSQCARSVDTHTASQHRPTTTMLIMAMMMMPMMMAIEMILNINVDHDLDDVDAQLSWWSVYQLFSTGTSSSMSSLFPSPMQISNHVQTLLVCKVLNPSSQNALAKAVF